VLAQGKGIGAALDLLADRPEHDLPGHDLHDSALVNLVVAHLVARLEVDHDCPARRRREKHPRLTLPAGLDGRQMPAVHGRTVPPRQPSSRIGFRCRRAREGPEQATKETAVEIDIWRYRDEAMAGIDITGFGVEAIDGSIGHIEAATATADGQSAIVIDTGPWIFGKKVMLPAGVIDQIDTDDEKVYVNRTKDEIKSAPEYDASMTETGASRSELGSYYGQGGRGWRDWTEP
jgi:hypothetical protein